MFNVKGAVSGLSRRSFLKGTVAAGAASALYGCSKNDADTVYMQDGDGTVTITEPKDTKFVFGTTMHNCGGKCISRAEISNGRIIRILSDESVYSGDGEYLDPQKRNNPQMRACSKCRSYKYRVYHPGRLKYPMKQTRKRGDLNGFQRISWDQMFKEIAVKHKTVINEYGPDAVYSLYATAAGGPNGSSGISTALRYMQGSTYPGGIAGQTFGSYSTHQNTYFGVKYTGMGNQGDNKMNANSLAKYCKTLVMWGDNSMTTRNNTIYAGVKTVEDMKARDPESKVIFIGPEFCDGGVTLADEWVVSKPYTDPALVAGMIYHMLDNTFDLSSGALKDNPWLDIDYLDTMVYGFFDSPEHILDETSGNIDATVPQPAAGLNERSVPAVPPGRSYCSWILGNNGNAKTYDQLGKLRNYTSQQYAAGIHTFKRWEPCSYERQKNDQTVYVTKKHFQTPKTPDWAESVTGVPADVIKQLAKEFVFNGPVASHWSGGQQKQADGIANLYALQALHIITKNAAEYGSGFAWYFGVDYTIPEGALTSVNIPRTYPAVARKPIPSCTAWHTTIKAVYADELRDNGYRAKFIPNWSAANNGTLRTGAEDVYWDDAGSKAAVYMWKRESTPTGTPPNQYYEVETDALNNYYQWQTKADGTPKYAGIRLMYNNGGSIFINQHENSNDSADMLEHLNLNKYDDADSFCLVTFDNFLSPTARYSDYVLPATTSWEHSNYCTPYDSAGFYVPPVTAPPGESKSGWDAGVGLLKAYEEIEPAATGAADDYCGGKSTYTYEYWAKQAYYAAGGPYDNIASPYYRKTWDEYLKDPYLPSKANDDRIPKPSPAYETVQNYKKHVANGDLMLPFIQKDAAKEFYVESNEYNEGGYTAHYDNASLATAPKASLRFQVFSPVLTWQYVNRYSKWHGHLPAALRGQKHTDFEGDRLVLEIPIYYAYEDYHMEAYGSDPAKVADLPFLLTTTHDRYRAHSSMVENPMMRELSHRVPGRDDKGEFLPANDFNRYLVGSEPEVYVNETATIPGPAADMNADGTVNEEHKKTVSYAEIWMNDTDGRELLGLQDGDLVQVENPIGAVRCVARLTKRCARGFVGLHQGSLYDPRPLPNSYNHPTVDVGGNCNTLMASQPSRIDHGNGQQSAMVKIVKVDNY